MDEDRSELEVDESADFVEEIGAITASLVLDRRPIL
jgi:hypothetical protein